MTETMLALLLNGGAKLTTGPNHVWQIEFKGMAFSYSTLEETCWAAITWAVCGP